MGHDDKDKGPGWAPPAGVIRLGDSYTHAGLRTFAVDEALLKRLQVGDKLYLKGSDDDEVVLCSAEQTFALKMVENSNTTMLCRPSLDVDMSAAASEAIIAEGSVNGCHELHRIAPKLHRIRELLECDAYEGPLAETEADEAADTGLNSQAAGTSASSSSSSMAFDAGRSDADSHPIDLDGDGDYAQRTSSMNMETQSLHMFDEATTATNKRSKVVYNYKRNRFDGMATGLAQPRAGRGYTTVELLQLIQASEAELIAGLRAQHAIQLPDGRWRLLSPAYTNTVLETILNCVGAAGIDTANVPVSTITAAATSSSAAAAVGNGSGGGDIAGSQDYGEVYGRMIDDDSAAAASASNVPPSHILLHVALMHGKLDGGIAAQSAGNDDGGAGDGDGGATVTIDWQLVAMRRAVQVLQKLQQQASTSSSVNGRNVLVSAFMRAWQSDMTVLWPSSSSVEPKVSLDLLRGQVLIDGPVNMAGGAAAGAGAGSSSSSAAASSSSSSAEAAAASAASTSMSSSQLASLPGSTIRYFPRDRLHHEPAQRFVELFGVRSKWANDDIRAFLEDLVGVDRKMDDMLVSHARVTVNPDKSRSFSAR